MAVNRDKVDLWKADVARSVDFYNSWFMNFAPKAYQDTRIITTEKVEQALEQTENLTNISPEILQRHPSMLSILRMTTCPPLARDRLVGLSKTSPNLVINMEKKERISSRMSQVDVINNLNKIAEIIENMTDPDIIVWKKRNDKGTKEEVHRASTIIADRLCGSVADPIIRNAQEKRQLAAIKAWLETRNYREVVQGKVRDFRLMPSGTFAFRFNIPVQQGSDRNKKDVNIPIDAVIMRKNSKPGDFPSLLEAKSAGDFTNTNKRRKEEAVKIQQLRKTYGDKINFDLFLCGYFDSGYLGYEAAEGIDWVWEHRIDDLEKFGF